MNRPFVASIALLLAAAGCSGGSESPPPAPAEPEAPPGPPPLAGELEPGHFEPSPVTVSLDDLEPPSREGEAPPARRVVPPPTAARLAVAEGLRLQRLAQGLGAVDAVAVDRRGTVFTVDTAEGVIRRLVDEDRDGVAERSEVFADAENGLDRPGAVVLTPGAAFVAQRGGVMRHARPDGALRLAGTGGRVATFPDAEISAGPALALAADRRHLYVGVGAGPRATRPDPLAGTILEINFSGSQRRTVASGLHLPAGLDVHASGALVVAVAERRDVGPRAAADAVVRIEDGAFYGWPATVHAAERADPHGGRDPRAASTRAPDALLPPGGRARGLAVARGPWPERYRGGAFVALAGSAVEAPRVVFVPLDPEGRPTGAHEDLLTGFAMGDDAWGAPTALLARPDGSLLVGDGPGGHLYRISAAPDPR